MNTPFALLSIPDFLRMWLTGSLVSSVRWLEMLAVGVFAGRASRGSGVADVASAEFDEGGGI